MVADSVLLSHHLSEQCCIDGLLERTIKHMLFLQSMTKHAENLKHSGESKIISKDGGLLLENNFNGGATWAFEVGSHSMVCPIIVEDLSTPRQILVEMLCEEQGLFLEIADIIRGLGLTILKGVMEARNDKVWVHFTVEVLAYLSTHGCSAPTRIECLSEKILPVGTEISAVGRVHTSLDGNPQIEACQDLPFFLSKMTKAEILVDLSATMTARLCIAIVLRSVVVGVIAYASRREWRQWKEWRKQRRQVQQLRSEAAAQVHESVDDEGANGGNSDMPLCVICFMRRRTVMFTPCGHLICCSTCALSFQEDSAPKCPMCREAISDCFKVYF